MIKRIMAMASVLLLASPAWAQSPGTVNLVGPSTSPGAPQVTPGMVNTAVNAALTAKADMVTMNAEITRATVAEAGKLSLTGGTLTGPVGFTSAPNVTAAGVDQGTATAVCAQNVTVTTAAYQSGIVLCGTLGTAVWATVTNQSTNQYLFYPRSGAQWRSLGTNLPIAMNPGGTTTVNCPTSTQCYFR